MAEEQSIESDGYYIHPEEDLMCPKPKFPKLDSSIAKREVSTMEGTVPVAVSKLYKMKTHLA